MQMDEREDGKKAVRNQTQISGCINEHTVALVTQRGNGRDTSLKRKSVQFKVWKILKVMGIPDQPYLPLKKSVCRFKKQQLELDMEQQTGFKSGKEYVTAVYCHPAYLTYMQSTS